VKEPFVLLEEIEEVVVVVDEEQVVVDVAVRDVVAVALKAKAPAVSIINTRILTNKYRLFVEARICPGSMRRV
jgi:hypothetical protein